MASLKAKPTFARQGSVLLCDPATDPESLKVDAIFAEADRREAEEEANAAQALKEVRLAIRKHAARITALLQEWDEDGNGQVSLPEFQRALCSMGVMANGANVLSTMTLAPCSWAIFDKAGRSGTRSVGFVSDSV